MNCLLPGSSVHGILQARILEYPFPSPGDLPDPGINQTWVSHIAGQILYHLIHKGSHSNKTFMEVLYTLLVDQELTHQFEITIPRNGSLQDKLSWLTTDFQDSFHHSQTEKGGTRSLYSLYKQYGLGPISVFLLSV